MHVPTLLSQAHKTWPTKCDKTKIMKTILMLWGPYVLYHK